MILGWLNRGIMKQEFWLGIANFQILKFICSIIRL